MATEFKVTTNELVEHAWLDNFLDAQTMTIKTSGTRPARTTNTSNSVEYSSLLPPVDSQQHQLMQQQQQQQQQPQFVKCEHSYSLDNDNDDDDFSIKIEPEEHGEYRTRFLLF